MKNCLILVLFIISIDVLSQVEVSSQISAVSVFRENAEITREAVVDVEAGNQEIVLLGISTSIIPSSIQLEFMNTDAILLSAKFEKNYISKKKDTPKISELKKQLEDIKDRQIVNNDRKKSLEGMEEILNKNMDLGGENSSFSSRQLLELINTYENKFLEIREKLEAINKKQKLIKEKINRLNSQLVEYNAKNIQVNGNIVLRIQTEKAEKLQLRLRYTVENAGWNPIYDIRSKSITEDVRLNYKAIVFQNTGQDWTNVFLKVSTSNFSQDNNRPILSPLYANYLSFSSGRYDNQSYLSTPTMAVRKSAEYEESFEYDSEVEENQLNVEFVVKGKRTIESDGKENQIALDTYILPTDYVYQSIPKINSAAFLLAKISDWSQYYLLAGRANLFFEGAFVGVSNINPGVTADTLLISLGRDNSIIVERLVIEEKTSSKLISNNKKETFAYELIVKNKKSTPINIEVIDQIPISQNSEIRIELEEKGGASYNERMGKLLWKFSIGAGQTKKDGFEYSVKYPKNKLVRGKK